MKRKFDKILSVIKRFGGKVVVLKDDAEFVVTSLDEYSRLIEGEEKLSNLSESEMLDKINRDIAAWRAAQNKLNQKQNDEPCFLNEDDKNLDWDDSFDFDDDETDNINDFDFKEADDEDNKVRAKDILQKSERKNNFGYFNPIDLNNPLNDDTNDNSWLKLDNNDQDYADSEHIPPPPDIN